MKIDKVKLIISSVAAAIPVFMWLIFWNKLPDPMPIHWNMAGEIDGYAKKSATLLLLPTFLLLLHLLCVFATAKDKKNADQNEKVFSLVYFLTPVISIVVNGFVLGVSLGYNINVTGFVNLLMGLMLLIIGNYLPKARQNRTIGIKIKWTLASEANWNATHRFAGRLWFLAGLILVITAFLPETLRLFAILITPLISVLIPIIYSHNFHKKEKRDSE